MVGDVLPGIVHVNVQLRSGEEFESNVDAVVGAAQADDFGTRRCLDQVVDLAIWDEILVVGILGEEREFEKVQVSSFVLFVLDLPEMSQDNLICA